MGIIWIELVHFLSFGQEIRRVSRDPDRPQNIKLLICRCHQNAFVCGQRDATNTQFARSPTVIPASMPYSPRHIKAIGHRTNTLLQSWRKTPISTKTPMSDRHSLMRLLSDRYLTDRSKLAFTPSLLGYYRIGRQAADIKRNLQLLHEDLCLLSVWM